MADFTAPRTWVATDILTAAQLNTDVRDNTLNQWYRVGSDTTARTTTSTTITTLSTITITPNVGVGVPLYVRGFVWKTGGAAFGVALGLQINTTEIFGTPGIVVTSATNQWESGVFEMRVGPQVGASADTLRAGTLNSVTGSVSSSVGVAYQGTQLTDAPAATVTSLLIRGRALSGSVTLGIDEVHVYAMGVG